MVSEAAPQRIAFIINPISGLKDKKKIIRYIGEIFDTGNYICSIHLTAYEGHAIQLAQELSQSSDIVAAVGGDGTLNEVARGILKTNVRLGIIPCGSGNGLARHLKIPLNTKKALIALKNGKEHIIDAAIFNGVPFFNLSGIGFDAQVAHKFAQSARRGALSYLKNIVKVYCRFHPVKAVITIDNQYIERNVLLIAFANSSQFGNNAVISPISDVSDGMLEICILKPFSFFDISVVIGRMFTRSMHKSRYLEIITANKATIKTTKPVAAHLDGSPFGIGTNFDVSIEPGAIRMIF